MSVCVLYYFHSLQKMYQTKDEPTTTMTARMSTETPLPSETERWKRLCANIGDNMDETRRIILQRFESQYDNPCMLQLCRRFSHEYPKETDALRTTISQGILNFTKVIESPTDLEDNVVSLILVVAREYRVWDDLKFRMHDGIAIFVSWIPHLSELGTMASILPELLKKFPYHVFHCDMFVSSLVYLIVHENVFNEGMLDYIMDEHPTECLILMSRTMCDGAFRTLLPLLKSALSSNVWRRVEHAWLDRLSADPSSVPVTSDDCPITLSPMVRPCVASDGFVYEQSAIMDVLARNMVSPMTREVLDMRVVPKKG